MIPLTQQPQLPRPGRRFGGLILASIALHGLLLSAWNEMAVTPPASTTLTLQLLPATPPLASKPARLAEPASPPQTVPVARQVVQTTEETVAVSAKIAPLSTSVASAALAATTTAIPEGAITKSESDAPGDTSTPRNEAKATQTLAELHGMMRTTLTQDINRHFKYPQLGRHRAA